MTLFAVTGKAQGLNAVESAIQATDQALSQLGRHQVSLAFIAASHDFPVRDIVSGVTGLLSDTPIFGFSTPAQISTDNIDQRSIVVALLAGDQVVAEGNWWSEAGIDNSFSSGEALRELCNRHSDLNTLLIATDLNNQDPESMIQTIPKGQFNLAGCLAGGYLSSERCYQIGGNQYGHRGLAAVTLRGRITTAVSSDHGWQPVGVYSRITHSTGRMIHTLDGQTAADKYAHIFGYSAKEWKYPPLNHLVRLYPLGVESDGKNLQGIASLNIHSPQKIDADGNLLMNRRIEKGGTAYYLVSSIEHCLSAARRAASQALFSLSGAEPVLALVFADIAWQMMLPAQPGSEIQVVREVIGADVPIIGGYTYGQIHFSPSGEPELLNQHFQVVLFGNPAQRSP